MLISSSWMTDMHKFNQRKLKMNPIKNCRLSLKVKLSIAFLVLTCFAGSCDGSGAYMRAFRHAKLAISLSGNETKIQLTVNKEKELNQILRGISLQEIDERFSKCEGLEIRDISILEIQHLFAANRLTSVQLTNCYLQRIYHMNSVLHAVIEVNPDAVNIAYRADIERLSRMSDYGPLHGIPVLVKDNYDTRDSMESTAGSWALLGIRPKSDADVVAALRKSGAVIIGKATLSEMSNFRGTNIPNGWSDRGGQTRNPYNLFEDPEGSSSGSAVAVASNLVTVAIGTETDGSLICPASVNGISTIKATHGLISTRGIIPISHNQDVPGPMARTVPDLAILFDAMLPSKTRNRFACDGSFLNCLIQQTYSSRFRVGALKFPFWDETLIDSAELQFELPFLKNILQQMSESSVFSVVDNLRSPFNILQSISYMRELTVLLHDFKHDMNEYLTSSVLSPFSFTNRIGYKSKFSKSSFPLKISTLADIIQFNIDHPSPEGYNQDLLIMAEATDGLQNLTYIEARDKNRGAARALLDFVLDKFNLDAIVVPAECRLNGVTDENLQESVTSCNSVSAIAGYPSIVIPAGIGLNGVPFGINFIGKPLSENKLFPIAFHVEQMIRQRESPRFLTG